MKCPTLVLELDVYFIVSVPTLAMAPISSVQRPVVQFYSSHTNTDTTASIAFITFGMVMLLCYVTSHGVVGLGVSDGSPGDAAFPPPLLLSLLAHGGCFPEQIENLSI